MCLCENQRRPEEGVWSSVAGVAGNELNSGTSGRSENNLNPWVNHLSSPESCIFLFILANHSKGQQQDFLLIILDLIPMFLPVKVFNTKLLLVVVMVVALEIEPTKASHMLGRYLTFNPCPQL